MEVRHILERVRQQKEEEKEYFFALQIDAGLVKSAIWTVDDGRVKVLSLGREQEWDKREKLVEAVDESLSVAIEKFFPQEKLVEPNKVIFGLPSEWVAEEKIVSDRIQLLKMLSQKLELIPVGFVVTIEAIIHHLKSVESVPPMAVLVGGDEEKLKVILTRLGKIIGRQVVKRSDNLGADLAEGLSRFKDEEQFPARILLYGIGVDLEKAKQELINYHWQDAGVNFLHLPKVEILPADFDIKAIALAGGREVAKAEGLSVLEPAIETRRTVPMKEVKEGKRETFGFIRGKDIVQEAEKKLESELREERTQKLEEKVPREKKRCRWRLPALSLPQFRLPEFGRNRFSLVAVFISVIIFIIGGLLLAFYWYFPQAEVALSIAPQKLEKEFVVKLDPALSDVDKERLILPAQEVKVVVESGGSRGTTGTKKIGDPAQGEVTIYNRTANEKVFSAGTEITGPDSLTFSLNGEVKVASESASVDYTKVPGKAVVGVTALVVGTEGNLAAGAEFGVANFAKSDFVAKNESAFSGGTSRELQVVSEDDQEKLIAELKEELRKQAVTELLVEVSGDGKIVEESLETEVLEESFDKAIGDEADEVKLDLKMEAIVLSYDEKDLYSLIQEEITELIPSDFEYRSEESEVSFEAKETGKDKVAVFTVHFRANLVPRVDLEALKRNLAGKYPSVGKTYLENLPYVKAIEIKITPRLPRRLATFPRVADRIKIELKID